MATESTNNSLEVNLNAPVKPLPEKSLQKLIATLVANWQEEKTGAATYRALAAQETDEYRKSVLNGLAAAEENHARMWGERLAELGAPEPRYDGPKTGEANSLINQISGTAGTLRRVELEERRHILQYGRQLQEIGDEPSIKLLQSIIEDERRHSKTLRDLDSPTPRRRQGVELLKPRDPAQTLDELRARRGRKSPASWIGDAIYGVNDGLGAIFGIVSGVSGATLGNSHFVLLAGIAGMAASALSMGSGAYLAAKSEREIYDAEIQRKRDEVEANPDEARLELSLIYQVKGVPEAQANILAEHLSKDRSQMLKTLAAEELNLTEEALSNPITSAVSGAVSTAVGAFVPIIPFFFMRGIPAVIAAAIISLIAHFAVGAAKSIITVRSWWSSGLEMTFVGAAEGVVTYVIGVGLGHVGA